MDADIGVSGHISGLWQALGCRTDDTALLSAMLAVGEPPVDDTTGRSDWMFVNSGISFDLTGGILHAVDIHLVYDRTSGFNGITVPSWLVSDWHERPDRDTVRQTFARICGSRPSSLDLAGPRVSPTGSTGDVFESDTVAVSVVYDRRGRAMSILLGHLG